MAQRQQQHEAKCGLARVEHGRADQQAQTERGAGENDIAMHRRKL